MGGTLRYRQEINALGQVVAQYRADGTQVGTIAYDGFGRPQTLKNAMGEVISIAYNAGGLPASDPSPHLFSPRSMRLKAA